MPKERYEARGIEVWDTRCPHDGPEIVGPLPHKILTINDDLIDPEVTAADVAMMLNRYCECSACGERPATMSDAQRVEILTDAIRSIRDHNKAKTGKADSYIQGLCRAALKTTAESTH